jgi:hypothetical protein
VQVAAQVVEDHAGRVGLQELDASLGQRIKEVQCIELVDERVGELHEHLGQPCSVVMTVAS